ncbi:hypothetical protein [Pedobacter duraquae]|uniref:Uncharacterized protein n=1 Tax=Pedobacter duraquae TaxID=425511 RepID=A0A4R6IPH1_9SPHI|nr:hypothetical protein [Pedobacter duraquae]TDO24180.1 hypothetical protein CLV32_0468 [Pedobacter duraquae]
MELSTQLIELIQAQFKTADQQLVQDQLISIELRHVMAESAYNLNNTRNAVLFLAKGDLKSVIQLTEAAKIDFRDVISWAVSDKLSAPLPGADN